MEPGKHYKKKKVNIQGILTIVICVSLIAVGIALKFLLPSKSEGITESTEATEIATESPTDSITESKVDKSAIVLVNRTNFIDEDYIPELREITNGMEVSTQCWGYLKTMLGACETAGMDPIVCSAYRPYSEQEQLFEAKVEELLPMYDYNEMVAYYEAQRYVARPGASEHQLGLAVDIVDMDNQNLETYQEDTPTQMWLMNNSWKYGFILRYPDGTDNWTGVKYEPWHYRFVGIDAAKEIHDQDVCLEQYLREDS